MTSALFAGSFDPIHRGHLDVIELGSRHFERLWVVAAGNPSKSSGLFSPSERLQLIRSCTGHLRNVDAVEHAGLLVDAATSLGVDVLLRAIGRDQALEYEMARANAAVTGVVTMFVLPEPEHWSVSSSVVRERFYRGDLADIGDLVADPVAVALRDLELAGTTALPTGRTTD
jgi:pantetheine-phosphate adenylyltransferase